MLDHNLVVCGMPNLIELYCSLAYKECFSIYTVVLLVYMVWFVSKMRLRHMCTFASENLTVKGLMITKTTSLSMQ